MIAKSFIFHLNLFARALLTQVRKSPYLMTPFLLILAKIVEQEVLFLGIDSKKLYAPFNTAYSWSSFMVLFPFSCYLWNRCKDISAACFKINGAYGLSNIYELLEVQLLVVVAVHAEQVPKYVVELALRTLVQDLNCE